MQEATVQFNMVLKISKMEKQLMSFQDAEDKIIVNIFFTYRNGSIRFDHLKLKMFPLISNPTVIQQRPLVVRWMLANPVSLQDSFLIYTLCR